MNRTGVYVLGGLAVVGFPLAVVMTLVIVIAISATTSATLTGAGRGGGGVNTAAIPPAALELLPEIQSVLAASCPELPAPWLIAEIEAESSWNPHAYSSAGAAGLTQMLRGSWEEAGGPTDGWSEGERPGLLHQVWDPVVHLRVAVPWMCGHLRAMTRHLAETGKTITPLQAMAVCHIAGCSRVTGSKTGIPNPGEANCDLWCSTQVIAYVERITQLAELYTAVPPGGAAGAPVPYTGGSTGCVLADPTSGGCLTGAAAHLVGQVQLNFGTWTWGVACWDRHEWNPTSDHPLGKACDYTVGRIGQFPSAADTTTGWGLASWFVANADALQVKYVIFQGTIWQASRPQAGWAPYSGGGVYDPSDPTGGHYDHVHVSTRI